jgi:hypothetical protein
MNEHDDVSIRLTPKKAADVQVYSNERVEHRRRVEDQGCCVGGHQCSRRSRCCCGTGGGTTTSSSKRSWRLFHR